MPTETKAVRSWGVLHLRGGVKKKADSEIWEGYIPILNSWVEGETREGVIQRLHESADSYLTTGLVKGFISTTENACQKKNIWLRAKGKNENGFCQCANEVVSENELLTDLGLEPIGIDVDLILCRAKLG